MKPKSAWTVGAVEDAGGRPRLTLADFLLARLAEDEAVAVEMRDDTETWGNPYATGTSITYEDHFDPARVLAEVAAKRAIVEAYRHIIEPDPVRRAALEFVCRTLAKVHADHPDYDEEWGA